MYGSDGLSPLTRGTRQRGDLPVRVPRFIPADAGNSRVPVNSSDIIAVYPR